MSRYILVRRLRGPLFLLLVGVNALLAQQNILGWGQSWPLYLILAGVLMLAERAALASEGYLPYPGTPWQGAGAGTAQGMNPDANSGTNSGAPSPNAGRGETLAGALVVPTRWQELEKNKEGGQS